MTVSLYLLALWPAEGRAAMTADEVRKVLRYVEKADRGEAEAQFNLGRCYAQGEGVEKDLARAFSWCRKAAEQGHTEAQLTLARCYADGDGVVKDEAEAYAWFTLAAPTSDQAGKERGRLEKKLTPARLDAARRRAKELQQRVKVRPAGKSDSSGLP